MKAFIRCASPCKGDSDPSLLVAVCRGVASNLHARWLCNCNTSRPMRRLDAAKDKGSNSQLQHHAIVKARRPADFAGIYWWLSSGTQAVPVRVAHALRLTVDLTIAQSFVLRQDLTYLRLNSCCGSEDLQVKTAQLLGRCPCERELPPAAAVCVSQFSDA